MRAPGGHRHRADHRRDFGRIAEFDALFIRETTNVNHHLYRFARRAASEGLVVIDDPDSILRCTNKIYLCRTAQRAQDGDAGASSSAARNSIVPSSNSAIRWC